MSNTHLPPEAEAHLARAEDRVSAINAMIKDHVESPPRGGIGHGQGPGIIPQAQLEATLCLAQCVAALVHTVGHATGREFLR